MLHMYAESNFLHVIYAMFRIFYDLNNKKIVLDVHS